MNVTRHVKTAHSDYAFDYENMMFTRTRREPGASVLRREALLVDGHPFTHVETRHTIDGRPYLYVYDTHSGYYIRSTEILSDTSETIESPASEIL